MPNQRPHWKGPPTAAVMFAALASIVLAEAPVRGASRTVDVTIREYPLANAAGTYDPHDPAVDAQGNAWYTGFGVNAIGRLDPATGVVKEYTLPTPTTGPHGVTIDAQGFVWYTGNRAGLVGRLHSATGSVVEFKMPNPAARDPPSPTRSRTTWCDSIRKPR